MSTTDPGTLVPAVEVHGLVKRYGDVIAVGGVDLVVHQGDVYGYLGPNGAGKTTSMRMLLGLIKADQGTVRLFGRDPFDDTVGALEGVAGFVETPRFYPYLTGRDNLRWCAGLDGGDAAERIDRALELVELNDRAQHRAGGYSFGMKQRLGIAAALLRDPRLLILDEPTTGLDPGGQRDMRELIRRLAGQGLTVLLSSHNLAEVEDLCTRVAIVDAGRIVHEGSIADLKATASASHTLHTTDDTRALKAVRSMAGVPDAEVVPGDGIRLRANDAALDALSLRLAREGIGVRSLVGGAPSLEELFFHLTGSASGTEGEG
jgi:ABC-2 type transport system ATP-binding protein